MSHVLRAEGLCKAFKKKTAVHDMSIELHQGTIVGLLGPNGAGKTTTFRMITGEITADKGRVLFDADDISRWPMYRRARLGIAYLPQEPSAFRGLTTEENVMAVLQMNGYSRQQIRTRLEQVLNEFDMNSRRHVKAKNLSGGERRRLEVMRAVSLYPSFVLLDEPFAGVDPIAVEDLQRVINNLKNMNIGVLLTDHNVHETLEIVDRAYVITEGKILMHGPPSEVAADPLVRKVFLGERFAFRGVRWQA
jgi:lipopolysaccharide export system ATP-binding protein